jgi:hypothetical protein
VITKIKIWKKERGAVASNKQVIAPNKEKETIVNFLPIKGLSITTLAI